VLFSTSDHPYWSDLQRKENLTYSKERAKFYKVNDQQCLKTKGYKIENDSYAIEFLPGNSEPSKLIHKGSIEEDINNPRESKRLLEYFTTQAYQRQFLVMS
jgi:hypothetical protein